MSNKKSFLLLSLLVLISFSFLLIQLFKPLAIKEKIFIEIKEGSSLNQIINNLEKKKVIPYPFLIKTYLIISGKSKFIYTGEYQLLPGDNTFNLINKLSSGDVFYRQIRLKEASTFLEVLANLKSQAVLKNDLEPPYITLRKELSIKNTSLEGLFSPDTYFYQKGDNYSDILKRAYNKQQKILTNLWSERRLDLPYKSSYEALILASIIEKEGKEKKDIAGVFIRRLKLNMKLQSDPTVIFALGKKFDGDIKRKDLQMKHPYNTYVNKGLPPGPIGLVSETSLIASFMPSDGSYLYFVSKGDGTHHFSETLEEHNEAVRKYQLIQ